MEVSVLAGAIIIEVLLTTAYYMTFHQKKSDVAHYLNVHETTLKFIHHP